MAYIAPKVIMSAINERVRRLNTSPPSLKYPANINHNSPERCIKPLYSTRVTLEQFEYCMNILESLYEQSDKMAMHIAKCISTNVINGLDSNALANVTLENFSLPDNIKEVLYESLCITGTCERILYNQSNLSRRFNVDKIVRENVYDVGKCIEEMCSFIDTYEIPKHYKLNIALENITYTLLKNGVSSDEVSILDKILEYFMMRDESISDTDYSNYKKVISENSMFTDVINKSALATTILKTPSDYYRSLVSKTLSESSDIFITEILSKECLSIETEADASSFIENVSAYAEYNDISDDNKVRLSYSIRNIPNFTPVPKQFVNIKAKEVLPDDYYKYFIGYDGILPESQPIIEKDSFATIFDKSSYRDAFNEADGVASTDDIKDLITKFKAEQDKSPSKIKNFFTKLHTKSPEVIIDDLPDIMGFARAGILLAIAASSPIGPIISGVLGLVSWLISRKINDKEANRLLTSIRSEKKNIKEKIDKTSNETKKKELNEYLSNLETCEKKVMNYLDSIEDEDHDDSSDYDDDMDDFDIEFESAIDEVNTILCMVNEIMEFDANQITLFNNIEYCAKNGLLSDISCLVRESSISIKDYIKLLEQEYHKSNDPVVRTAITSAIRKVLEGTELGSYRAIAAADISNKALLEASSCIIQEKVNLNALRLALQSAKSKLKDLSTKEKSMWQTVDAQGSGLVKSIEKALTSDRREAIIKGSIIPSFSKCIKGAIALAGVGVVFGPMGAIIAAIGGLATSSVLNVREKRLLYDEIDTELKVVEKQLEIAQNDGDMNQYRFLLNYQKKLTREAQRIKYGLKVQGRDIPAAVLPGRGGNQ